MTMSDIRSVPSNINEICRLCLSEGRVTLPIFGEDEAGGRSAVPLSFRILACVSVEVSPSDGLPTIICKSCLNNINRWHDFKQTCDSAQATLKEWQSVDAPQENSEKEISIKQEPLEVEVTDETVDISQESDDFLVYEMKQEEVEVVEHDHEHGITSVEDVEDDPLSLTVVDSCNSSFVTRPVKLETIDSDVELIFQLPGEDEEPIHQGSASPSLNGDDSASVEVSKLDSSCIKSESLMDRVPASTGQRRKIRRKRLTLRRKKKKPGPVGNSVHISLPLRTVKPFLCSLCDKAFSYNYLLKRHMVTHTRGRNMCSICKKGFSTKSNLERHVRLHSGAKPYTCQDCFQEFAYESIYVSHINGEQGHACPGKQASASANLGQEIFDCYLCKNSYPSRLKLKMHMTVHSQYRCPKCKKTFSGGISLSNHLRSHSAKGFKRHSCRMCLKSFSNIAALASHKKYHYNIKRVIANTVTRKLVPEKIVPEDVAPDMVRPATMMMATEKTSSSEVTSSRNGITCKVCGKWVKNHSALSRHMTTHTKLKLFSCTICKASMGYASSVHKHMKLIHGMSVDFKTIKPQILKNANPECSNLKLFSSGVRKRPALPERTEIRENKSSLTKRNFIFTKNYKCKFCHKIFPNKHVHATHLKLVHLGKKTYKCTVCNKVFAYKSFLIRHSKVHVGQILYTCGVCLKSFADQKTLNNHKGVHTRFRYYSCTICKKSFNGMKAWEQHEKMHKRGLIYSCKLCGKKFISKSELHQHKKMHIKLKIYSCTICKNSYHSSSALSKHKRKHAHDRLGNSQGGFISKNAFLTPSVAIMNPNFVHVKRPVCNVCKKSFSCASALTKHKRLHIKKRAVHSGSNAAGDKDDIVCVICSRQFTDYASLIRHKGWHTRRPESVVTKAEPRMNPCFVNLDSSGVVTYDCSVCNKSFTSNGSLSKHLRLHYPDENPEEEEKKFSPYELQNEKTKHIKNNKQRYTCTICTKHFQSKKALITHRGWHSRLAGSKKQLVTPEKKNLVPAFIEAAKVKEEPKNYFCSVCSKSFTTASALGKHKHFHTRKLLSSIKNNKASLPEELQLDDETLDRNEHQDSHFPCNICPKTFKCEEYLLVHMRIHTGERPFVCDLCPQAYHRRSNLWKHKKTHGSSFKAFSCAICHKKFALKKQFTQHALTHSRPQNMFPCSTCDRAFTRMDNLRHHEKSHA